MEAILRSEQGAVIGSSNGGQAHRLPYGPEGPMPEADECRLALCLRMPRMPNVAVRA
jgi:hypothetical protein